MGRILKSSAALVSFFAAALVTSQPAAAASAQAGAAVFKTNCAVCHSDKANGPSPVGPRLFGVVGRKAGTVPGFSYSNAMKKSGITWTQEELKKYVANPAGTVPGNRMPFAGLHKPNQVDDLIAFLASLK